MDTRTIALEEGKKRKSQVTGYLHQGDRISFYENLLFALALFRSRTQENILEGKVLLEKLLDFQITKKEHRYLFPNFLHEYPNACSDSLPIKILPLLYLIQKEFSTILGKALKRRLSQTLLRMLTQGEKISYSFPTDFLIAIMKHLLLGSSLDEIFAKAKEVIFDWSSEDWGEILFTLSLLPEEKRDPYFEKEVQSLYHPDLAVFVGPLHQESYIGFSPKESLLSLFFRNKPLQNHLLLEGAKVLLPMTLQAPTYDERKLSSKWGTWHVIRKPSFSYTLLEKKEESAYKKDFHIFRLLWGKDSLNSLVLQEFSGACSSSPNKEGVTFRFTLPPSSEESSDELQPAFYLDAFKDATFWVNGKRANTFLLGETLTIEKDKMRIHLTFSLLEGEGRFFGHILKKNRPGQNLQPTKTDFTVYDWQIGLRTLKRAGICQIQVKMSWEEIH